MELFLQATAAVMLAVILGLSLGKQGKELGILLTIAVCVMVFAVSFTFLEPVIELLDSLEATAQLQGGMLEILLKAVGIGLVAEIAALVCADAGNGSLGKALQLLASAVILWLSVPVFTALMNLIRQILGEL